MPNSNNQNNSSSGLKTAATFGLGALVGALAAGAAYFFSEDHSEPRQSEVYHRNHPAARQDASPRNGTEEKDDTDEKDGTVTMCEICFVKFSELKECGVQIVSTTCGHVYCKDCILGAINVKPECPHCRNEVHPGTLRRIYL